MGILKNSRDMNIVGQGWKILLFTVPSLAGAVALHILAPAFSSLPGTLVFLRPAGFLLLVAGLSLWATALVQLLAGFPRGVLVTRGAYGIVRNPLYSSVALLVIPAVSMITLEWVYLPVSAFLVTGVLLFTGAEERKLAGAFGEEYLDYCRRVPRILPGCRRWRASRRT